ncbi:enhancer of mRNA-decapping protein 4 [Halyomorpha halys]|uniref:enhancer of mRNA-decapping protein 4 n=1 Tax=Halyomorpha halys TaxID=286706 RepID=UPI0006D4CD47|nr:enhancer of mRNA-decapping protein 4 [Halyomorpha halys]XP_014275248.1 enhancer of mRNA-decapping protein 4 [Halyomorpha halys]
MTIMDIAVIKTNQTINFSDIGEDETARVLSENVSIVSRSGGHVNGSSKVKLSNVVDYSWEEKFYPGQLLAVHMSGNYVAYSIKGANYAVRVVNRETAKRALIKGIGAMVEDLAFAFIPGQTTLACVDETGAVYVHNIFEDSRDISTTLILHILQTEAVSVPRRVFWCPYIPDEEDLLEQDPYSEETSLLLAVTRDNKIEVWNVANASNYGSSPVKADSFIGACVQVCAHESTIVDAAFSPDGTAIATASVDGECKFFQVYMQSDGEPTCLHRWKPHGGKPVTTLFFLDDHKSGNPEVKFWKYAVTGTDDNSELKLWTCESWKCLQTINFKVANSNRRLKLKACVDLSAGFIFVSDMFHRVLYVLELEKTDNETVPFVRTVTEFMLPCPVLSFAIVDAGLQNLKPGSSFGDELCNGEDEENQSAVFMARLYLVQPKSLQECHIVYQVKSLVQGNTACLDSNGLSDEMDEVTNLNIETPPTQQTSLNLMTPDAFHSPHSTESTTLMQNNDVTPISEGVISYSGSVGVTPGEPPNDGGGGERRGFVSGGSSPSREVEEILSSPRFYSEEPKQTQKNSLSESKNVEMNENLRGLELSIQELKSDIKSLSHTVGLQSTGLQNLQEEIKRSRGSISTDIEGVLSKAVSTFRPVSEEDIARAIAPLISQAVLGTINPAVIKSMTELHNMVHQEVSQKLFMTEQNLKDSLSKVVKSKAFTEVMANSLSSAAASALETVFKETFIQTAVPMFEAACSNMFLQISDTFSKGVNDAMKDVQKFTNKLNERANLEVVALQTATERINQTAQHFTSTVEKEAKGLEDVVVEMERRLKACMNGASVRSGTVTPAQHLVDPHIIQSQIALLIKQGQYNTAFQQALSASDLNLVTYVCEKVDTSKVFTRCGCVLQQHVLLSLIQQLAADMTSHSDVKQKYLEEAVMNLSPGNENTREHMPQVLTGLQKQLQLFQTTTNDPRLASKARMLVMVCQQIVRNLKDEWD